MILTEKEATSKWCPFARVVHSNQDDTMFTAANSFGDGQRSQATRCIASECMAWRWKSGDPHKNKSGGGILLPRELWPGYCGLADVPTKTP